MKAGFFYYLKTGFWFCFRVLQLFWAVCRGVFIGVLAGFSFLFALIVATLKLLGVAAYEVLIEDWRDRKGSVPPAARKPNNQLEIERFRREKELIEKFKQKL
jgi:hypothetical protein